MSFFNDKDEQSSKTNTNDFIKDKCSKDKYTYIYTNHSKRQGVQVMSLSTENNINDIKYMIKSFLAE